VAVPDDLTARVKFPCPFPQVGVASALLA
jgi:hypothetical protein